jgi:hypothetical protein
LREGSETWEKASIGTKLLPNNWVSTAEGAGITLELSDQSIVRVGGPARFRLRPTRRPTQQTGFHFLQGLLYLFHRDKPSDLQIEMLSGVASVRSTELNLEVAADGRAVLALLEGVMEVENEQGQVALSAGEQVVLELGQRPVTSAVLDAANVIQWTLYYPAVLDIAELEWSHSEQEPIRDSVRWYLGGDLPRARETYPAAESLRRLRSSCTWRCSCFLPARCQLRRNGWTRCNPRRPRDPGRLVWQRHCVS